MENVRSKTPKYLLLPQLQGREYLDIGPYPLSLIY